MEVWTQLIQVCSLVSTHLTLEERLYLELEKKIVDSQVVSLILALNLSVVPTCYGQRQDLQDQDDHQQYPNLEGGPV